MPTREIDWIRRIATDSQIEEMLKQRDDLLEKVDRLTRELHQERIAGMRWFDDFSALGAQMNELRADIAQKDVALTQLYQFGLRVSNEHAPLFSGSAERALVDIGNAVSETAHTALMPSPDTSIKERSHRAILRDSKIVKE